MGGNAASLNKYYAIAIDIGTRDRLLSANRQVHDAMTRLKIPHSYEEYDGDHANRLGERIETPDAAMNFLRDSRDSNIWDTGEG